VRFRGWLRMSNQVQKNLIPALRFPEYRRDAEWEIKELGQLASYTKGYAFKSKDYKKEGVRVVRVSDLAADHIKSANEKIYITYESAEDYERYKIQKGDIIITTVGSKPELIESAVGRGIYVSSDGEGLLNQNLLKLEVFLGVNSIFLFSNINTTIYLKFIASISRGNANQANIAVKDFLKYELKVPAIEEQKKIADCISSIDELVGAENKKLEALKAHKKGLMQQLFPAECETVPKLRFPEFQGADDWKLKPLSKLFEIGGGKDHKHLPDGDIPVYGTGGFMRSVNEYLYDGESACIGRKGTINKPMFLTGKFWTVDTLFYTHKFQGCLPKFAYLLFQNINWLKLNEAGGVPSLSKVIINKVEVLIPEVDEQRKVVECIFSLDNLVNVQIQKVESLKTHKKSLIYQLFPSVESS
jgi:type I restriction enzyme S subunit